MKLVKGVFTENERGYRLITQIVNYSIKFKIKHSDITNCYHRIQFDAFINKYNIVQGVPINMGIQ